MYLYELELNLTFSVIFLRFDVKLWNRELSIRVKKGINSIKLIFCKIEFMLKFIINFFFNNVLGNWYVL